MSLNEVYLGASVASNVTKVYKGIDLVFERGGGGNDVDVQALLDQAAIDGYTACSGTALTALNSFVTSLKSDGIWPLLDALWLLATNGDSDFACYNLKDPTAFSLSKVNSPSFISLEGFTGDGVSAYLDPNFILDTNGVNYTLNSASVCFYNRIGGPKVNKVEMGADGTGNTLLAVNFNNTSIKALAAINDNVNSINNSISGNEIGFQMLTRPSSVNSRYYHNGYLITSAVDTSTLLPNSKIGILARMKTSGGSDFYSDDQISFACLGGDLSSKAPEMYTAIQTYMTAIGKQV